MKSKYRYYLQGHGAQGDGEAVGRPAGGAEARGGAGGGAAGLARRAARHRATGTLILAQTRCTRR